jgi:hypothetical protein
MMGGTKGDAQRASSLRSRCVGEVDPETATHMYVFICLLAHSLIYNQSEVLKHKDKLLS